MFLSIITPTYNRGNLLGECYKSLKEQDDYDFEWIVIDDGSSDNTREIVESFIKDAEGLFKVSYTYKENGGKHTALNMGIHKANGKLTLILDSDDILTPDAVSTIKKVWQENCNLDNLGVISFLRKYSNDNIIGDSFPKDNFLSNHIDYIVNKSIKGDKCEVVLTDVFKKFRFPEFKGEKFIGESIVWTKIAREYKTLYINKAIYITEYLEGGLTKSGRRQRLKSPLGGMALSNEYVKKIIY